MITYRKIEKMVIRYIRVLGLISIHNILRYFIFVSTKIEKELIRTSSPFINNLLAIVKETCWFYLKWIALLFLACN